MATITPEAPPQVPTQRSRSSSLTGAWTALRDALDRPLSSYYLLVGASALLLTIGLIMAGIAYSLWKTRGKEEPDWPAPLP